MNYLVQLLLDLCKLFDCIEEPTESGDYVVVNINEYNTSPRGFSKGHNM